MWITAENGSSVKPEALDTASSKKYNYIRKDFVLIEATEETPEHWRWQEKKVLKEDWETYTQVMSHDEALDDVYAALTELAGMIEEA